MDGGKFSLNLTSSFPTLLDVVEEGAGDGAVQGVEEEAWTAVGEAVVVWAVESEVNVAKAEVAVVAWAPVEGEEPTAKRPPKWMMSVTSLVWDKALTTPP